ncbi:36743_t:CDS:2, partial [Racocetra persica]
EALEFCYKRSLPLNDLLSDIYNGCVWHIFKDNDRTTFFSRVMIKTSKYPNGQLFHDALILIACDIPVARKISGFAGHSSKN